MDIRTGGGKFLGLMVMVASTKSELPSSCGESALNGQCFLKIFFMLTSLYFFSKSVLILRGGTKVNPGITSWTSCFFRAHCVF